MHLGVVFYLLLCLVVASNPIISLQDSDIQQVLQQSHYSFIYFYSDTCQYCSKFEPDFHYLSALYNDERNSGQFQVLKVNAKENPTVSLLFKVLLYPLLKLLNYDTKEIKTYTEKRDVDSLVKYVGQHTIASPNYKNVASDVQYVTNGKLDTNQDIIVVFAAKHIRNWENYDYPTHFYQLFASSKRYNHLRFAFVDIDEPSSQEIIRKYHLSNFPIMMHLGTNGTIKVYKAAQDTDIEDFLQHLESGEYGMKFPSLQDLLKHSENTDITKENTQRRIGLYVGENDDTSGDIDEDYDDIVDHIEL